MFRCRCVTEHHSQNKTFFKNRNLSTFPKYQPNPNWEGQTQEYYHAEFLKINSAHMPFKTLIYLSIPPKGVGSYMSQGYVKRCLIIFTKNKYLSEKKKTKDSKKGVWKMWKTWKEISWKTSNTQGKKSPKEKEKNRWTKKLIFHTKHFVFPLESSPFYMKNIRNFAWFSFNFHILLYKINCKDELMKKKKQEGVVIRPHNTHSLNHSIEMNFFLFIFFSFCIFFFFFTN